MRLNALTDMGTVDDMTPLSLKLTEVFQDRVRNHAYRPEMISRVDLSERERTHGGAVVVLQRLAVGAPDEREVKEIGEMHDADGG